MDILFWVKNKLKMHDMGKLDLFLTFASLVLHENHILRRMFPFLQQYSTTPSLPLLSGGDQDWLAYSPPLVTLLLSSSDSAFFLCPNYTVWSFSTWHIIGWLWSIFVKAKVIIFGNVLFYVNIGITVEFYSSGTCHCTLQKYLYCCCHFADGSLHYHISTVLVGRWCNYLIHFLLWEKSGKMDVEDKQ